MGYLIRMAPEVEQWLAAVRDRDPAAADLIDEAVAVLRAGGESVGPPLVVPLDDPPLSARPDLDMSYQRQLEMLTRVRRAVADVATSRKRLAARLVHRSHRELPHPLPARAGEHAPPKLKGQGPGMSPC